MRQITKEMEKLAAMFIIAMGEWDGVCFVYYPKLPKPFCKNLNVDGHDGDLLSIRVDPTDYELSVQFWFMDKEENHFFFTWQTIKEVKPWLNVAVFTHIYDMIENVKKI